LTFSSAASPFVVAAIEAGVGILPDTFNFCLLFFILSAANADIYTASRTLYGLSADSQAPYWFSRTNSKGVPVQAVWMSGAFILVAFMNAKASTSEAFSYLVHITTVFGALNWVNILLAYIGFTRALKSQGFTRRDLPYKGPLQPYGAYWALGVTSLLIVLNGKPPSPTEYGHWTNRYGVGWEAFAPQFDVKKFVLAYLGVLIWFLDIVGWKTFQRTRLIRPKTVSLRPDDGDEETVGRAVEMMHVWQTTTSYPAF
jgi:yeast amino acid transporter